ncbi:MAG: 4'-phosphopantetheinyl transferase superfamily protein [Gemmatimonadaceae bacterium]
MNDSSSDAPRVSIEPLLPDEVRVYTLDSGDGATVRQAARRILAALLKITSDKIDIFYTEKGKPLFRNDPALHFSISHSQNLSMIALTGVAAIGVDIEQQRAVPNAETILRRFFTHEEIGRILSDDQRDLRFIEAWTRAEARVKARGASVWEAATPDPDTTVCQLLAPDGFAAAVAVANPAWTVSQHDLSIPSIPA